MAKKVEQPHGGAVNQFEPGESGNPNGRPPKIFTDIVSRWKAAGFERATPQNVREVYEYLLALPESMVKEIAGTPDDQNNDYPVLVRIAARALTGKKGSEIVELILNRTHGRPRQQTEIITPMYWPQDAFLPKQIIVSIAGKENSEIINRLPPYDD